MPRGTRAPIVQIPKNERIAFLQKQIRQLELEKKKLDLDKQKFQLEIDMLEEQEEWARRTKLPLQGWISPAFSYTYIIYTKKACRAIPTASLQVPLSNLRSRRWGISKGNLPNRNLTLGVIQLRQLT